MAVELHRFLSDQLDQLPTHHPDRRLLEGLQETLAGYLEQTQALPEQGQADNAPTEEPATAALKEHEATPEQERVHLHGRLGYPPTFRTTPNAVVVGSFPLAVRDEAAPDQTTWWRIFVFRKRAEQLRELNLSKGQAVEVIGYGYDHTLTKRDGSISTEHRVNAVAVKVR